MEDYDNTKNKLPQDGIGAYSITTPDGKTYHYSLPVYQFEEFDVREETGTASRESKKFYEQRNFGKYAYAWLLTAITGPDFVDNGIIGEIDEEDYGYWVKFDYGKWTDGYMWRFPYDGYDKKK